MHASIIIDNRCEIYKSKQANLLGSNSFIESTILIHL